MPCVDLACHKHGRGDLTLLYRATIALLSYAAAKKRQKLRTRCRHPDTLLPLSTFVSFVMTRARIYCCRVAQRARRHFSAVFLRLCLSVCLHTLLRTSPGFAHCHHTHCLHTTFARLPTTCTAHRCTFSRSAAHTRAVWAGRAVQLLTVGHGSSSAASLNTATCCWLHTWFSLNVCS